MGDDRAPDVRTVLPSVDEVLRHAAIARRSDIVGREVVGVAVRDAIDGERLRLAAQGAGDGGAGKGGTGEGGVDHGRVGEGRADSGGGDASAPSREALLGEVVDRVLATTDVEPAARRVLNATGVLVHTNLGRAPLGAAATEALVAAAGATDVELDLATGRRGGRGAEVTELLRALTGAEDALVVNNGAAALVLALAAACDGGPVVVSRGELVEIGGSFRLPEVIAAAGVEMVEVGTTNRTHVRDYEAALARTSTRVVLRVHPSNFTVTGFTARPSAADLAAVVADADAVLVHDTGSGLLDDDPDLPDEPSLAGALRAGADLVLASGDKLLGGPQAGLLLGRADLVERARRHPLARVLRLDKLRLAALEATLRDHARDPLDVPAVAMRRADTADVRARADAVAAVVRGAVSGTAGDVPREAPPGGRADVTGASSGMRRVEQDLDGGAVPAAEVPPVIEVRSSEALLGAGSAPDATLPSAAVVVTVERPDLLASTLRAGDLPVLARVADGAVRCDLRSLAPEDDEVLGEALAAALRR